MTHDYQAVLRMRVSERDAHYAGGLVAGSWILGVFGDVVTELCLQHDGDEGLLRTYDKVDFLEPVRSGDFIEAQGRFTRIGQRSRTFVCEARRVVELTPERGETTGQLLDTPIVVARAEGAAVVPRDGGRTAALNLAEHVSTGQDSMA